MNDLTDQQLLQEYTQRRAEAAFGELVRRHVDLVYSAALRMVRDAHLAEDVTQSVFVALSQSAGQLTERPVLSGWLHRTTQNPAVTAPQTVDGHLHGSLGEVQAGGDLRIGQSRLLPGQAALHILAAGTGAPLPFLGEPEKAFREKVGRCVAGPFGAAAHTLALRRGHILRISHVGFAGGSCLRASEVDRTGRYNSASSDR